MKRAEKTDWNYLKPARAQSSPDKISEIDKDFEILWRIYGISNLIFKEVLLASHMSEDQANTTRIRWENEKKFKFISSMTCKSYRSKKVL